MLTIKQETRTAEEDSIDHHHGGFRNTTFQGNVNRKQNANHEVRGAVILHIPGLADGWVMLPAIGRGTDR